MSDSGTLRGQQAEFTRRLLMEAAQQVILDNAVEEFSIQKVAEQAGVSHRTVYRYFTSRRELLNALTDWIEESVAAESGYPPTSPEGVGKTIHKVYDQFDRYAPYYRASVMLASRGEQIQLHGQETRGRQLRESLSAVLDPLDPVQAEEAYVVIRLLVSAQAWLAMRDRFGLGEGEAGAAVEWAIDALVSALRSGHAPSGNPETADAGSSD